MLVRRLVRRSPFALALLLIFGGRPVAAQPGGQPVEGEKVAEEVVYRWDGEGWAPDSRVLFSYDIPDGGPTLALNQAWDEGAWTDVSKETWTLDADGRQATGKGYEWSDGAWSERMRMTFVYDAEGNKTAARRQVIDGDGVTHADSLASTFEGRRETERRFFRWQDGGWAEVLRQTSAYDAAGREVERLHVAPVDGEWEEQRRWTFTYEEGDQISVSVVEELTDGAWTPWLNQTYTTTPTGI